MTDHKRAKKIIAEWEQQPLSKWEPYRSIVPYVRALEAERDRYREALQKIASGDGIYGAQAGEYKQIARAALTKTPSAMTRDQHMAQKEAQGVSPDVAAAEWETRDK